MKQSFTINGREITITPTPFDGKLSIEEYESQLYSALNKIGVSQKFISILKQNDESVQISWEINKKTFSFKCQVYETYRENLGACVQAIKEDVRHILRGIKDINLVLKQYSTTTSQSIQKQKDIFSFKSENQENNLEEVSKETKLEIINGNHAKSIIQEIKNKYPQFSNYAFIPDHDRMKLEKAYLYLGRKTTW